MKFNRKTEADKKLEQFAKNKAKKMGAKAGVKAGKLAAGAAKKIALVLISTIGPPATLVILVIVIFMMIMPSFIFSTTSGMDGKYEDGTLPITVDDSWETNAETELTNRYNQLIATDFWEGLVNFFTTGKWNDSSVETFKTEYANADDLDESGKSVSSGYFSASNRLIAIINQAFITSKDDATTSGMFGYTSNAMKRAERLANSMSLERGEGSVYQEGRNAYPLVPEENITITVSKDPNTTEDFVNQACYIVAAYSEITNQEDSHDSITKNILDFVFTITGIDLSVDDVTTEICWEPAVTYDFNYTETPDSRLVSYWNEHKTLLAAANTYVDLDGDGYAEFHPMDVWQGGWDTRTEYFTRYDLAINFHYTLTLTSTFEDLVDKYLGITDTLEADAPSYELTTKDIVRTSSIELLKFYNGFVGDLGVVGLPLPEKSYTIGDPFGCMCWAHAPSGHSGQDLPAANGTGVFSVADGVVEYVQTGRVNNPGAGGMEAYGNCVFIRHTNDSGQTYYTRYAHMSSVLVTTGQTVVAGDAIGTVGDTGNSYGNHLHFEMWLDEGSGAVRVDPMASSLGELIRANANS